MADTKRLVQDLSNLNEQDWFAVLNEAECKRREHLEKTLACKEPGPDATAEQFAEWIAKRHLASDPGLREVYYLKTSAPPREIRLLEVNALLHVPEADEIQPVDFSPNIEGLDFQVFAADVTPEQFQAIQADKIKLPEGWDTKGMIKYFRG